MLFNFYIAILLTFFIYFGFLLSKKDWEENKIPNKIIIKAIKVGVLIHSLMFILTLLSIFGPVKYFFYSPDIYYFLNILTNSFFSLLISYLLWKLRFWAAGDAKMFFALSILFPLTFYKYTELPFFLGMTTLINVFLMAALFIFAKALFYYIKNIIFWIQKPKDLYSYFIPAFKKNKISYILTPLSLVLVFFVFFRLNSYIKNYFLDVFLKEDLSSVGRYLLPVFFLFIFPRVKEKLKKNYLIPVIFILVLGFDLYTINSLNEYKIIISQTIRNILIFVVILGLVDSISSYYIKNKDTKSIKTKDLKEEMMLSDESLKELGQKDYFKKIEPIYPEGLSCEQVEEIIENTKNKEEEVFIYAPRIFAHWIFLGYLFTLIFGQSIITLIRNN